jgi:26S proteasome regulatory subunit N8
MPTTVGEAGSSVTVSIAPLILLSACDHYGRSAKGTRKRVVGVLLGQNNGSTVRVTNSFAGMKLSRTRDTFDLMKTR